MDFFVENYKLLLEIFGYIGTALVIISMTMTSVLKLRIINMCGGSISLIYAVLCNTWPVVVLNACIICINLFQTIRQLRQKNNYGHTVADANDATVDYFLEYHKNDIEKSFPKYTLQPQKNYETHVLFASGEIVGVLIGARELDTYRIEMDYVIPRHRSIELGKFLFPLLRDQGINTVTAARGNEAHVKYLKKLGFVESDGAFILNL